MWFLRVRLTVGANIDFTLRRLLRKAVSDAETTENTEEHRVKSSYAVYSVISVVESASPAKAGLYFSRKAVSSRSLVNASCSSSPSRVCDCAILRTSPPTRSGNARTRVRFMYAT